MTTVIQVAYDVPPGTVEKIRVHLHETALRNCNWNGAKFRIDRAEYTCFPKESGADAVTLLHEVFAIINGETDEQY